jgi:hypothetical protein
MPCAAVRRSSGRWLSVTYRSTASGALPAEYSGSALVVDSFPIFRRDSKAKANALGRCSRPILRTARPPLGEGPRVRIPCAPPARSKSSENSGLRAEPHQPSYAINSRRRGDQEFESPFPPVLSPFWNRSLAKHRSRPRTGSSYWVVDVHARLYPPSQGRCARHADDSFAKACQLPRKSLRQGVRPRRLFPIPSSELGYRGLPSRCNATI